MIYCIILHYSRSFPFVCQVLMQARRFHLQCLALHVDILQASPALPKESQPFAPTLPNLQFQEDDEQNIPEKPPKIIIEPPKITIEITQPPLEKAEEGSAARSPTAPRSPGPTSPTSPNHRVLTPGVVERHILSEPAIVSPANSTGSASKFPQVSAEEDGTKRSVKTLFVQCFKDDLFQERQLLMSQINNLFKLRNNGEALQYKDWVVFAVAGLLLDGYQI